MRRTIMLRGKTEQERKEHEADGSLFLRGEDKNFSAGRVLLHFTRGRTWRNRYLPRMFS